MQAEYWELQEMSVKTAILNDQRAVAKFHLWQLLAPRRPNWPRNAREAFSRCGEAIDRQVPIAGRRAGLALALRRR